MINRRIIRIKIMQTLYAYFSGAFDSLDETDKDLRYTFDKIYDLYHYLLYLLVELNDYARQKIELAKNKMLPTEEDLNPNTKFIDNKIIVQLRENKQLNNFLKNKKFTWRKFDNILKEIYERITETDEYKQYMASDDNSYAADKLILSYIVEIILYNCQALYSALEEESIYWIDNVDFVLLAVAITIEHYKIGDDMNKRLLKKFKNHEDEQFAFKLLHLPILKYDQYSQIIKDNVINWDYDRIAKLDKIILLMAIAELLDFEEIPIKVSLNEYIELAKQYGIPKKSPNFVNGLLDKLVKDLKSKNLIVKKGRGLKDK